jgi:predicted dehydrogenase
MTTNSRRQFFAVSAATAASARRVAGANDRIRMGAIGTGGRGKYLMKEINETGEVEWAAVCDVYSVRVDEAATLAGGAVKTYREHERLLDHADIDAVVIATPDHWHGPIGVDACQAGKDIYVEKPMVHNPQDGLALVQAVRGNQRICQVGMQARAIPHWQEARRQFVESGALEKIGLVRTWYNSNAGYVLKAPEGMETQPEGLDWKRWLGRGPKVPWNPDIYFSPYKWLHYDGGMIMGIGIHVIDSARQFAGLGHPSAVAAGGGIYHFPDRDTPDVINLILEYPEGVNVTFEAEILTCGMPNSSAGIQLHGRGGILRVQRYTRDFGYGFTPNPKAAKAPAAKAPGDPPSAKWLVRNWLDCIRSRNKPVADEEQGHYSAAACYMGIESYTRKRRIEWNRKWEI